MLDIKSQTWEEDRAKAVIEFLADTITAADKRTLQNATGPLQWLLILRQKWALDHQALIDEARASNDLICRMFVALAEKP